MVPRIGRVARSQQICDADPDGGPHPTEAPPIGWEMTALGQEEPFPPRRLSVRKGSKAAAGPPLASGRIRFRSGVLEKYTLD
jgi:hypothetical protein